MKKEVEMYLKKCIKRRFRFTKTVLIAFLMLGGLSYSANLWIDNKGVSNGLNEGSVIWYDNQNFRDSRTNEGESVILSSPNNKTGSKTIYSNKNFNYTVVIGSRAVAGGEGATAIGYRAIVGENTDQMNISKMNREGTAIGYKSFAQGNEATALGNDTIAWGDSSIAIGSDNVGTDQSVNKNTSSIRYNEKALSFDIWKIFYLNREKFNYTGDYATLKYEFINNDYSENKLKKIYNQYLSDETRFKTHNWAYGNSAIAIGSRTIAYGDSSTALGTLAIAKGNYSTALGTGTLAFGNSALAIGNETYVYADNSVGVGNEVQAIQKGSIVYGRQSYAGGEGSLAIGTNAFSNVMMDDEDKLDEMYDAESTFEKLAELDEQKDNIYKAKLKMQAGSGEHKAEVSKNKDQSEKTGALALGYLVTALGENSVAIGRQSYAKGDRSIAIGPYAYSKGEKSFSLGYGSKSIGLESMAIGSHSRVETNNSIAIGINSKVKISNGGNTTRTVLDKVGNGLALGNGSLVSMFNSVALGYNSETDYEESDLKLPAYMPKGAFSIPSSKKTGIISVGRKGAERRITNLAGGALPSDAVNVEQLRALEDLMGLSFSDDDEEESYGLPYISINRGDTTFENPVEKQRAWKKYIDLKATKLVLKNREKNNGEEFESSVNTKLDEQIKKIEEKYKDFNGKLNGKLNDSMVTSSNTVNIEKFKEINNQIETSKEEALKTEVITEEQKEKMKKSNYTGNNAKASKSIAIGLNALVENGENGIALGSDSVISEAIKDYTEKWSNIELKTKDSTNIIYGEVSLGGKNSKGGTNLRKITNLAGGINPTDAVNVRQLEEALKTVKTTDPDLDKFSVKYDKKQEGDKYVPNKESITLGEGKEVSLKNVKKANLSDNSKDAVNSEQLKSLADKLGLELNDSNDDFKDLTISKLKDEKGKDGTNAPNSVILALNSLIKRVNKGFEIGVKEDETKTQYLGSKIIFTKSNEEIKDNNISYVGKNLLTKYENKDGNGIISIAMSEKPEFKSIKVGDKTFIEIDGEKQIIKGLKDSNEKDSAVTKGYVDGKGIIFVADKEEKVAFDGKIKFDSSESKNGKETLKDITFNISKESDVVKLNLRVNKSDKVSSEDERLVTSKAVSEAIGNINTTFNSGKLKYKANGNGDKEIELSKGLNFINTDNITSSVKDDGGVEFSLNSKLKKITSIESENGSKISFETDKLSINNKKISGLTDGEISENSKDAINGSQIFKLKQSIDNLGTSDELSVKYDDKNKSSITLNSTKTDGVKLNNIKSGEISDNSKNAINGSQMNDLISKLGISLNNNDKTKLKDISISDIDKNATEKTKSYNLLEGLNNVIGKINEGFVFGVSNDSKEIQKLGSSLYITSNSENISTSYENTDGNGKIKISLSETPKFTKVTIGDEKIVINDKIITFKENDGTITGLAKPINPTDAANKEYVDANLRNVKEIQKEIVKTTNASISNAIAMSNLLQNSGDIYSQSVSAAIGNHKDGVSLALGLSGSNSNRNLLYKISGAINNNADVSLGAGISYQFGNRKEKELVDINSIKKVVSKNKEEISKLNKEVKEINSKNEALENKVNEMSKELLELKEIIKKMNK